jgi:hypothetical protein
MMGVQFTVMTDGLAQTISDGIYLGYSPRLCVLVPGANDPGEVMLNNARQMFRYDPISTVIIRQADGRTSKEIQNLIITATKGAIQKGTDVIVLVDMDLDDIIPIFSGEWSGATNWAGDVINLVSTAFTEAGGKGERVMDCHSAGCDAVKVSLDKAVHEQGEVKRLFDALFLFNGRVSGTEFAPLLQKNGYSPSQVNLLLNKGDYPAQPHSISNLGEAKRRAGKSWTVFYAEEMSGRHMDHTVLIDKLRVPGTFIVFDGTLPHRMRTTVKELKMWGKDVLNIRKYRDDRKKLVRENKDFFKPPDPPDKYGGAGATSPGGVDIAPELKSKPANLKRMRENILDSRRSSENSLFLILNQ